MNAIRVSVTDIDALRFYLHPPVPEMEIELEALLRRLRREEPPTPAMLAGTAFHTALETIEDGDHDGFVVGDYTFSFNLDASIDLPIIRETKGELDVIVGDCRATLVGKVDGVYGKRVDDHKLTERFDAEKYLDSFQWKAYLHIFDADEFRWNIFEAVEGAPKNYVIRNFHPLKIHRYPGMAEDVERELREFVLFARDHLPERFQPVSAAA